MKTTASSNQSSPNNSLYCPARKQWVAASPEEIVRQRLIEEMIHRLDFPLHLIAVEKELSQFPHLVLERNTKLPMRRADIVCFGKNIHPKYEIYPLLLIECKAVKLTRKVLQQVVGYNHYLQACFVAVANAHELRTGWYDLQQEQYQWVNTLPTYPELLHALQR